MAGRAAPTAPHRKCGFEARREWPISCHNINKSVDLDPSRPGLLPSRITGRTADHYRIAQRFETETRIPDNRADPDARVLAVRNEPFLFKRLKTQSPEGCGRRETSTAVGRTNPPGETSVRLQEPTGCFPFDERQNTITLRLRQPFPWPDSSFFLDAPLGVKFSGACD